MHICLLLLSYCVVIASYEALCCAFFAFAGEGVELINQFLPKEMQLDYFAWDYKRVSCGIVLAFSEMYLFLTLSVVAMVVECF